MTMLARKLGQLTNKSARGRAGSVNRPAPTSPLPPAYTPPANPQGTIPTSEPPPYTEQDALTTPARGRQNSNARSIESSRAFLPRGNDDTQYAFLSEFDTVFLIDDSTSMVGHSGGRQSCLRTRWGEAREALQSIVEICVKYDSDGVDMYFLNGPDRPQHHNVTNAFQVMENFQHNRPGGYTFIGRSLNILLEGYIDKYEQNRRSTKPLNIIVITDGEATDDPGAIIKHYAALLDTLRAPPHQVGVQFFQVGNDANATRYLNELDDELSTGANPIRDIVDTVPYDPSHGDLTGDGILKVVLGAVNRRLDRRVNSGLQRHS